MICIDKHFIDGYEGRIMRFDIICEKMPEKFPTMSDEIDNLPEGITVGVGSRLICLKEDTEYVLGESGWFRHFKK